MLRYCGYYNCHYTLRFIVLPDGICALNEDDALYNSAFPVISSIILLPYKHFASLLFLCELDLLTKGSQHNLVNIFTKWQGMLLLQSSVRNAISCKICPVTYSTVKYYEHTFFLSDYVVKV